MNTVMYEVQQQCSPCREGENGCYLYQTPTGQLNSQSIKGLGSDGGVVTLLVLTDASRWFTEVSELVIVSISDWCQA